MPDETDVAATTGSSLPVPAKASGLQMLPSIGGTQNDLRVADRAIEVVRIAILLAIAMAALVLFALGAIKVLS